MTAYTAQLTITATTAWDTWYGFSDRACHDTATVYRWYIATFFSAKAKQRYEEIGQILGFAMVVAVAAGITARVVFQKWVDAEVQSCLPTDHVPDAGEMVEADPFSPAENQHYPAMAATIAPAVATLVVNDEPKTKHPTTAELRKMAIERNRGLSKSDSRYIAGAARLTKAQALKALGMA